MTTVKSLQTQLGRDLVATEQLTYLEPDQLKLIEDTYQKVYDILSELNKKQDTTK
jgi:hypothetical protein